MSDTYDELYKAVQKYVEANGGSVLVIGGVQLIQMPDSLKYNYTIGVKCTGVPPVFRDETMDGG